MAKGFKHGAGGGSSLNFKVVGNPQPSSAKENTIWVDTDKINNYYFSATQPENMAEYDVWFPIGTSSSVAFNALKGNGIQVYPISAKQYVSGSWVDKIAKSYQGGKWVDWITYLFNNGSVVPWSAASGSYSSYVTINEKIIIDGQSNRSPVAHTTSKINVTNFTKLKVKAKYLAGNLTTTRGASIGLDSNVSTSHSSWEVFLSSENEAETDFEANIANISGERYILLGCYDAKYEFTIVCLG